MDEVFQRFLRQSGPVLCLDIGSVTQDVVLARSGVDTENWPRFVLPSPSQTIAQRIRELTLLRRDVWLYGVEMGGNFAPAVESCLKSGRNIYATRAAADSLDRNPAMVRQMGVVITEVCPDGCVPVDLRDYSPQFWDNFLRSAGMPQPHLVLAAVQDHGIPSRGSNRASRREYFAKLLQTTPSPINWMTRQPPAEMTRLVTLARETGGPVADTLTAALLGALSERTVMQRSFRQGITVINIGNEHLFAALVYRGTVRGLYECHTREIGRDELMEDLRDFRSFTPADRFHTRSERGVIYGPVTGEGGTYEPTFILGPQRNNLSGYGTFIAPYGEMMTAGAMGLLWGHAILHSGRVTPAK